MNLFYVRTGRVGVDHERRTDETGVTGRETSADGPTQEEKKGD